MLKYQLPEFLNKLITQNEYEKWLSRKAKTHYLRDKKRGYDNISNEKYKILIHQAVINSKGNDTYTGEPLDWSLLSKYNNVDAENLKGEYKKQFALLPTVDHTNDNSKVSEFKICSWRTNDSKNDLSYDEFVELCVKVLEFKHQKIK